MPPTVREIGAAFGFKSTRSVFDYLNAWMAGDLRADYNGLYGLDTSDVFAFLNGWFHSCP